MVPSDQNLDPTHDATDVSTSGFPSSAMATSASAPDDSDAPLDVASVIAQFEHVDEVTGSSRPIFVTNSSRDGPTAPPPEFPCNSSASQPVRPTTSPEQPAAPFASPSHQTPEVTSSPTQPPDPKRPTRPAEYFNFFAVDGETGSAACRPNQVAPAASGDHEPAPVHSEKSRAEAAPSRVLFGSVGKNTIRSSVMSNLDSCPVCLEPYHRSEGERKAKILPCLHTVCLSCLQEIIVGDSIKCPLCRQIVLVPSEGPDAFMTNSPETRKELGLPQDPAQWFRSGELLLNPQQLKKLQPNRAPTVVSPARITANSRAIQQPLSASRSATSTSPRSTANQTRARGSIGRRTMRDLLHMDSNECLRCVHSCRICSIPLGLLLLLLFLAVQPILWVPLALHIAISFVKRVYGSGRNARELDKPKSLDDCALLIGQLCHCDCFNSLCRKASSVMWLVALIVGKATGFVFASLFYPLMFGIAIAAAPLLVAASLIYLVVACLRKEHVADAIHIFLVSIIFGVHFAVCLPIFL